MRLSAARDWDNYLYFYVVNIFLSDIDPVEIDPHVRWWGSTYLNFEYGVLRVSSIPRRPI